jgi:uncharacterized membrane protein
MPDKNIVDDYYSQMDSSSDESISKDVSKKPTIVAKKKIIVKKPQMVSTKEGVIS